MQVMIWPVYITGQLIATFGAGFIELILPRIIEEIVPFNVFTICCAAFHLAQSLSGFLGSLATRILPPDNDRQALAES